MTKKFNKILNWFDENILLILSGFLIAFIPLFPKIPLVDLIPGYIVRMRIEDIFVFITALVWFIQVLRKKVKWHSIIFSIIVAYLVIGLLSILSAIFVIPSIPLQLLHIGKTVLHWVRYFEYFMLFAITFSAVKSKKDVQLLIYIVILTTLAIVVYGYGQRYYYWPVYSTMNREFSKGVRLYLTENARVQSTFAGHYDLAAYLVIVLNLILALALKATRKLKKMLFYGVYLVGLWLLILTASRASYIAYYCGTLAVIALITAEQKTLAKKLKYGLSHFVGFSLLMVIMTLTFGKDIQDRFLHVMRAYPEIEQNVVAAKEFVENSTHDVEAFLGLREKRTIPDNWIAVDNVLTNTDERPTEIAPDRTRPDDVYVDVPITTNVATESADGTTTYTTVSSERTWSANAMKYGLSTAIRLDTLWPNAINGFKFNPLLGKGYATLNKESFEHFTEAESTDNNYLRILGETGLLGFITFFAIVVIAIYLAFKFSQADHSDTAVISIGYIGASIGLLVNALYIDVFASSKIAFTYWAITGAVMALYTFESNQPLLGKIKIMTRSRHSKSSVPNQLNIKKKS